MKLSVIIPAYNEAERITKTLFSIHEYLSIKGYDYEIIVVIDGSCDDTVSVVTSLKLKIKNLKLISNEINRGKGSVVRQGMLQAKGEYRLFMDADNSTTIDHIEKFWPYTEKYDVIIGSRRVIGADIRQAQPWYKDILGRLGNWWIQLWTLRGIKDTQAGFKLFSATAVDSIFSKTTINRWGFDFEALAIAKARNLSIKEVPILWKDDPRTHVTTRDYLRTLFEAVKVRWNIITGHYK